MVVVANIIVVKDMSFMTIVVKTFKNMMCFNQLHSHERHVLALCMFNTHKIIANNGHLDIYGKNIYKKKWGFCV
jgi:hypothetical protein